MFILTWSDVWLVRFASIREVDCDLLRGSVVHEVIVYFSARSCGLDSGKWYMCVCACARACACVHACMRLSVCLSVSLSLSLCVFVCVCVRARPFNS